jgi:hypothetical protein
MKIGIEDPSPFILTMSSLDLCEVTSSNQKEVMRDVARFNLFFVFSQNLLAQSTDTIGHTISNGKHIASAKGTSPVIYDKDWVTKTPEDQGMRLGRTSSPQLATSKRI